MFFLYSILLTVGFVVLLPRFLFRRKYAAGLRQRFGKLPAFEADGRPVLWLHCVSVGETNAARPLVKELKENFPDYVLVVSTTTLTGQTLAKKVFADDAALVFYFPFDWKFTVRRALRHIKPHVVVLMETELWFNFIREANKSGAKVFIVNGRLSEKSVRRYGLIPKTMRRVLHHVDLALMQTSADMKRLLGLGSRGTKVRVTGNVKFDQTFDETESDLTKELRTRFDFSTDAPLIVAASTHAPEEKWILQAFGETRKNSKTNPPRLLIAPRHPERFAEVEELIKANGFDWAKRSAETSESDKNAAVILLDSIGELRAVYPLSEIVFVGGSLIPHGGQSVLEPAIAEKAVVTGFYTANFNEIVKEFLAQNALVQLPKLAAKDVPAKLAAALSDLLNDAEKRGKLAKNAFAVMKRNRGATAKTIEYIKTILLPDGKI
ncbi:MAG: 3-deoxy-D-manno-octulosonic acid transferase [Pyrinomonadaceae bacterium]|nr:3-deoxy-D-manno-octulosonic acid transferase [Pyrinomonadaceae bacterium]